MIKLIAVFTLMITVNVYSQVVINELMYAPVSPAKEWFEIYNSSSAPVNLQNWKWKDAAVTNPVRTITTSNILLNGNSYAVICEDSANFRINYPNASGLIIQSIGWNALNNSGSESLVLKNNTGTNVDSLAYTNSWGGTGGFSLERINPIAPTNLQSNWGSSIAPLKATPGRQNSITPKQNDLMLKSFIISPVFPNTGDTLKHDFVIKNLGINQASNFSLNIYTDFFDQGFK